MILFVDFVLFSENVGLWCFSTAHKFCDVRSDCTSRVYLIYVSFKHTGSEVYCVLVATDVVCALLCLCFIRALS